MEQNRKSSIKSAFASDGPLYRRINSLRLALTTPGLQKVFSGIYLNNSWADDESVSGRGSTFARTEAIRTELPALLKSIGANSLIDAACGDFNWLRHIELNKTEYIGIDIVPQLIARNRRMHAHKFRSFITLDITSDALPKADVILCRDCLIHLSFEDGLRALDNFKRSGSTFLLATTHTTVTENVDIDSGAWRNVNLQLPPYGLPEPQRTIIEDRESGKALSLWRLK